MRVCVYAPVRVCYLVGKIDLPGVSFAHYHIRLPALHSEDESLSGNALADETLGHIHAENLTVGRPRLGNSAIRESSKSARTRRRQDLIRGQEGQE